MANISAKMVKELRDKTGAGMMDCKKALVNSDGDMEQALDHLRKAGIAKAEKKAGRSTDEGIVGALVDGKVAVVAEVSCETDFAARNEKFQDLVNGLLERAAADFAGKEGDITEEVAEKESDKLTELVLSIGENMKVRRVERWESDDNFAYYIHTGSKIGVLAEVKGDTDEELLQNICMHIAAFRPQFVGPEEVPEDVLAKEREIAAAQVEGKPANIIDKIVEGKLRKWYTETCLIKQPWIRDDKTTLEKVAPGTVVRRFVRWEVGEEI